MDKQNFPLIVITLGLLGYMGSAAATPLVLPNQTLGDISGGLGLATYQTNWDTNGNYGDGLHAPIGATTTHSPLYFTTFDSSLGSLNMVTITLSGAWIGELHASNASDAAASATVSHAVGDEDLVVKFWADVFNDYDGTLASLGNIEKSGYSIYPNYSSAMYSTDVFDAVPLPATLAPGDLIADNLMEGGFAGVTIVYTGAGVGGFVGDGVSTWAMGCGSYSEDGITTSGGTGSRGHTAYSQCTVGVQYDYGETQVPEPMPLALLGAALPGLIRIRRKNV